MRITDCKIYPVTFSGRVKAFASIVLENVFVVKGMKVISGQNGLYVAMPTRKKQDGSYEDVAHAITKEFYATIQQRVLSEYDLTPNNPQDESTALEQGGIKDKDYEKIEIDSSDLPF